MISTLLLSLAIQLVTIAARKVLDFSQRSDRAEKPNGVRGVVEGELCECRDSGTIPHLMRANACLGTLVIAALKVEQTCKGYHNVTSGARDRTHFTPSQT